MKTACRSTAIRFLRSAAARFARKESCRRYCRGDGHVQYRPARLCAGGGNAGALYKRRRPECSGTDAGPADYVLGGEQSGHTIFLEYATTGDGELTALQFLQLLSQSGLKASELVSDCKRYPQELINIAVAGNPEKERIMASDWLAEGVREQEKLLGENGRVLVRTSGTEALVRVMVEAKEDDMALKSAQALVETIKKHENLE